MQSRKRQATAAAPAPADDHEDDMDLDEGSGGEDIALAPEYAAAKRLEYDDSHRTRVMQDFLKGVLATLKQHVRAHRDAPLVGSFDTIVAVDERRESASSQGLARMSAKLDMIHSQIDYADMPAGDPLQTAIYQAAACPPFRRPSSGFMRPLSLQQWSALLLSELALVCVGLVRLGPARHLLVAEWHVEHMAHAGFAIVLHAGDAAALPADRLLSLDAMTAAHKTKEAFCYAGYMYVDSALVAAAAGLPDMMSI